MRFCEGLSSKKYERHATITLLPTIVVIAMSASAAAQCIAYPTTLANGSTADATQVMGDLNYLAGCLAPKANPYFTGSVGIGTTTAWTTLTVRGSSGPYGGGNYDGIEQISNTSGNDRLEIGLVDGSYAWLQAVSPGVSTRNLVLNPGGNGNVGIGTSSPSKLLNVGGGSEEIDAAPTLGSVTALTLNNPSSAPSTSEVRMEFQEGNVTQQYITAAYNSGAPYLAFGDVSSERMRITSSGYVGIGTTSPSYPLQVAGSVGATGYTTTSDKRLKKDIVPIGDALATIEKLRGVRFNWRTVDERTVGKDLKLPTSDHQVGFIAQELQAVLPEAVTTAGGSEAIMSVQESKVAPVLVEAVKELKAAADRDRAEIAQIKAADAAQIAQLKAADAAEITQLKASNARLKASNEQSEARLRKIEAFIAASGRKTVTQAVNTAPVGGG